MVFEIGGAGVLPEGPTQPQGISHATPLQRYVVLRERQWCSSGGRSRNAVTEAAGVGEGRCSVSPGQKSPPCLALLRSPAHASQVINEHIGMLSTQLTLAGAAAFSHRCRLAAGRASSSSSKWQHSSTVPPPRQCLQPSRLHQRPNWARRLPNPKRAP